MTKRERAALDREVRERRQQERDELVRHIAGQLENQFPRICAEDRRALAGMMAALQIWR